MRNAYAILEAWPLLAMWAKLVGFNSMWPTLSKMFVKKRGQNDQNTTLGIRVWPLTSVHVTAGRQTCRTRLSPAAYAYRAGVFSQVRCVICGSWTLQMLSFYSVLDTIFLLFLRYLVLFNPVEQERLCVVTVLVNSARIRVLTEDGQTLPVQLSAQWVSAVEMSGEVYQVCLFVSIRAWILNKVVSTYTFHSGLFHGTPPRSGIGHLPPVRLCGLPHDPALWYAAQDSGTGSEHTGFGPSASAIADGRRPAVLHPEPVSHSGLLWNHRPAGGEMVLCVAVVLGNEERN